MHTSCQKDIPCIIPLNQRITWMQKGNKARNSKASVHRQGLERIFHWWERLGITYGVVLLSVIPCFKQAIAHRVCRGLVSSHVVEVKPCAGQSVLDVIDDGSLDGSPVCANVRAHQLPHLFLPLVGWLAELWPVQGRCRLVVCLFAQFCLAQIEARVLACDTNGVRLFSLLFDWGDELWVYFLLLSSELLLGWERLLVQWMVSFVIHFTVLLLAIGWGLFLDSSLWLIVCCLGSLFLWHLSNR